jgi:hypothetical protein
MMLIEHNCGHTQSHDARRSSAGTVREHKAAAHLKKTPCRGCKLVRELKATHGFEAKPEFAEFVCRQRLQELRLFVLAVLTSHEDLRAIAGRLFTKE